MKTPLRTITIVVLALTAVLLAVIPLIGQQPAPALPYTAPDMRAVQAGKAPLRVLVVSRKAMLAWKGEGDVRIVNLADRKVLYTAPAGEQIGLARATEDKSAALRKNGQNFNSITGSTIRLESDKPIKLWTPDPETWTSYPGPLIITLVADSTFSIAREMQLDEYLRNVVPSEMPVTFHPQALRAQAVIARTYTLTQLGRHADEGADVCATVHCQVCGPDAKRSKATDDALAATKGLVLLYGDKLAETYYHASCGGATDDAGYIWGPEKARPYLTGGVDCPVKKAPEQICVKDLQAKTDLYCKNFNNNTWTKTFTVSEINALASKNLGKVTGDETAKITTVTNMAIEERTPFGRVASLRVEGDGVSVLVYGDQARWLFGTGEPGPDGLWSTLFDLAVTKDANGAITGYTFTGAGRGHGLGLCQWGADGRGKAGQTFREILKAYYPGTRLSDEKK